MGRPMLSLWDRENAHDSDTSYRCPGGTAGGDSRLTSTITVTTSQSRPTVFLSAIGISQVRGHGQAHAQLVGPGERP